jgi:hypothetical protein
MLVGMSLAIFLPDLAAPLLSRSNNHLIYLPLFLFLHVFG